MPEISLNRRSFLTSTIGLGAAFGLTACSNSSTSNATHTMTSSSTLTGPTVSTSPTLAQLASVKSSFTSAVYTDTTSKKTLPYNVFLPQGYSHAKKYPVVVYIADASLVGQSVTAPLSQYGALIWASPVEQAKHQAIVIVPEYPEVILDDHSGYTTTEYVELTARFMTWLKTKYSIDPERVYGTGQSMGCMTALLLASKHPTLYTATLLVSGQWEKSALTGIIHQKFFHICAAGDSKASQGQKDLKALLTAAKVPFGSTTLNATAAERTQDVAVTKMLATGDTANFATFTAGSVLKANPVSSMEHMASFQPAYELTALRDWLFAQKR